MMKISYKCRMTTEALEHLEMLQGSLALAKIEKFNDQLRDEKLSFRLRKRIERRHEGKPGHQQYRHLMCVYAKE